MSPCGSLTVCTKMNALGSIAYTIFLIFLKYCSPDIQHKVRYARFIARFTIVCQGVLIAFHSIVTFICKRVKSFS